ncbi:MAG: hypothetical protein M3258_01960 [Thermoproteota archaeon]|nr:hypothetical protein [Thermoproteota archaeon]
MVIEDVRYNFEEFPSYANEFVRDLLKLMIISKMNSAVKNLTSKNHFMRIISQIEDCEAYIVKYGQPLLYTRYHGMEFTDQKITTQFVRSKNHIVDVTMESLFGDFVKSFDNLASMTKNRVKWGITKDKQDNPDPLFALLDSFISAVVRLSSLDASNPDSLKGKRFGIRNASIIRKSLYLELLINGQLHIIELNPCKKRKDDAIKLLLFSKPEVSNAIVALMKQ